MATHYILYTVRPFKSTTTSAVFGDESADFGSFVNVFKAMLKQVPTGFFTDIHSVSKED